ncbi:hypothetical protein [Paenarthrobacter sp. Z7-10]|uniref:hypothetical protein n=1 Tax=Paenarthrobacter sp. Z7-10 TaxID=2787635 RepID=UPI0022A9E461|nr:hypothetical protein [Paenarthrobacter sp. Z7-10]
MTKADDGGEPPFRIRLDTAWCGVDDAANRSPCQAPADEQEEEDGDYADDEDENDDGPAAADNADEPNHAAADDEHICRLTARCYGSNITEEREAVVPQVAAARAIATIAHKGQTDKSGADYITHPSRVAGRLTDPQHVAAAWLHDVLEDCGKIFAGPPAFGITAEDLLAAGIEQDVVDAVVLLTRTADNAGDRYYEAIRANAIAKAMKLADIAENTDPARTAKLTPETREKLARKYAHALAVLGAAVN